MKLVDKERRNLMAATISGVTLGIPTIARVVSHLVRHVLTETQLVLAHATSSHEQIDAGDKIA